MRALATGLAVIAAVFFLSTPAFSQAAVAGTVKDSSGRHPAGRDGRSVESGAHREVTDGRD